MKMKQFIHAVFCALTVCGFLLLGASCSKENEPVQTVEGVTVTIAAQSDLQTRTSLPVYDGDYGNNISGVQHVTDVYLYIYEMNDDGTGVCRAQFNVGWREHFGQLPTKTAEITYTLAYTFTVGRTYRLVAVGVDGATEQDKMPDYDGMNSKETYGLPESIEIGSKLTDPIMLQKDKTPTDMAHSEFFTGFVDFTPQSESNKNIDKINLWRRVAGLQVCLTNIPREVERVRILLYNSQNTQVKLLPSVSIGSGKDKVITDYITSPYNKGDSFNEEGRVLTDKVFIEKDIVDVDGNTRVGSSSSVYQCSMTAFMLPMNIPDRERYDYTLVAEFVTTSITGIVGTSKKVRLMKPWQNSDDLEFGEETDIATGIIDDLGKYLFPIEANHFYCLGTPSKPIDCSKVLNNN
ncbi:FimB/Mfa2 family fimbrial subunit [Phocaeicola plebeius]|uniref:FimB/Mfa2 family fimbrial subunit n=1 Tax=Phocaeicola plebeius TaxID=310297 RepID=UPI0021ACFA73|nr:FimB/Mfa2 family fimbrial subunit [Phocaeicola plebeius]MCR8883162.1 FimB/Mfa2 family fimbrial subunit [Phocaeicola plebeius]MDM8286794.1 FimB/Mfa2 family fimbrial subunit [Phocaeicola plebeius]